MMDELTSFVQQNDVEIVALTLPKDNAIDVANILVENGLLKRSMKSSSIPIPSTI